MLKADGKEIPDKREITGTRKSHYRENIGTRENPIIGGKLGRGNPIIGKILGHEKPTIGQGSKLKKMFGRKFATSYENLVANLKMLVAKLIEAIKSRNK